MERNFYRIIYLLDIKQVWEIQKNEEGSISAPQLFFNNNTKF